MLWDKRKEKLNGWLAVIIFTHMGRIPYCLMVLWWEDPVRREYNSSMADEKNDWNVNCNLPAVFWSSYVKLSCPCYQLDIYHLNCKSSLLQDMYFRAFMYLYCSFSYSKGFSYSFFIFFTIIVIKLILFKSHKKFIWTA